MVLLRRTGVQEVVLIKECYYCDIIKKVPTSSEVNVKTTYKNNGSKYLKVSRCSWFVILEVSYIIINILICSSTVDCLLLLIILKNRSIDTFNVKIETIRKEQRVVKVWNTFQDILFGPQRIIEIESHITSRKSKSPSVIESQCQV